MHIAAAANPAYYAAFCCYGIMLHSVAVVLAECGKRILKH